MQNIPVIIGVILIIIMFGVSCNLYIDNCFSISGNYIGIKNTIKKIFNRINNSVSIINNQIKKISENIQKKEVFNISENNYTYDEAKLLCKAFNSELATYNNMDKAYKRGANWCNYGWIDGQMAVYPIQEKFYKEIQKTKKKGSCGKIGINGGYFKDKKLKFGVNCYGRRPKPDKSRIIYIKPDVSKIVETKKEKETKTINEDEEAINKYKKLVETKNIIIMPFSDSKWSKYSLKKSRYLLTGSS